ncbi:hypothetical protein X975_11319, partial [Stegodyphus mimosarum]
MDEIMSEMVESKRMGIDSLPFEMIEYIMNCDELSFMDICRLSSVCRIFNCIAKSNKLWQNKYKLTWSHLADLYDAQNTDWKFEFCQRYELKKLISERLEEMTREYYHHENISHEAFVNFRTLCAERPINHNLIIDELNSILHATESHLNLTIKYYAKKCLRFVRHLQLETEWRNFLARPSNKITLLEGACLISQWCQPTDIDCLRDTFYLINNLAGMALVNIRDTFPDHPAVLKERLHVSNEVLEKSLWSPSDCKILLKSLNYVFFRTRKYQSSKNDFSCAEYTFIDKVICRGTGIPIVLGILYQTVAARLGVACFPINVTGHIFLKWLEHPQLEGEQAYTFIDILEGGAFRTWAHVDSYVVEAEEDPNAKAEPVPARKLFIQMCWNLVEVGRQIHGVGEGYLCLCDALELLSILSPDDMENKLLLARVYMHLAINMTEVISLLQEIAAHDPLSTGIVGYMHQSALTTMETQKIKMHQLKEKLKVQTRDDENHVKFAVGMIMKHKIRYNYRCVIYGWDSECVASRDWIKQMGVYKLPSKDKQPFYHVLAEDGTNRYAAQENLEID